MHANSASARPLASPSPLPTPLLFPKRNKNLNHKHARVSPSKLANAVAGVSPLVINKGNPKKPPVRLVL